MLSDDDDEEENDYDGSDDGASKTRGRTGSSKQLGDEVEDEDDERHLRMLQGITGMPSEVFEGKTAMKMSPFGQVQYGFCFKIIITILPNFLLHIFLMIVRKGF